MTKLLSDSDLDRAIGGAGGAVDSTPEPGGGVSIDWNSDNGHMWDAGISPADVIQPGDAGDSLPGGWAVA